MHLVTNKQDHKADFDRSAGIDFQGPKITTDTGGGLITYPNPVFLEADFLNPKKKG